MLSIGDQVAKDLPGAGGNIALGDLLRDLDARSKGLGGQGRKGVPGVVLATAPVDVGWAHVPALGGTVGLLGLRSDGQVSALDAGRELAVAEVLVVLDGLVFGEDRVLGVVDGLIVAPFAAVLPDPADEVRILAGLVELALQGLRLVGLLAVGHGIGVDHLGERRPGSEAFGHGLVSERGSPSLSRGGLVGLGVDLKPVAELADLAVGAGGLPASVGDDECGSEVSVAGLFGSVAQEELLDGGRGVVAGELAVDVSIGSADVLGAVAPAVGNEAPVNLLVVDGHVDLGLHWS